MILSAFSWPSRVVTTRLAQQFNFNEPFKSYSPSDFDFQYVRPSVVQELLRNIVCADVPRINKEIDSCIAASFHCDASMDNMQKDHEYMLLNVIKENGERDLKFIGIGYVTEPGAAGHLTAIKSGANDTVGFDQLLKVVSHLSTDGENKNVGIHGGLWKLLDDEREKADINFPLLKSVCSVHFTVNAYKDLCNNAPEIDHVVKKVSVIATFLHASAKRTTDLEQIGKMEGLTVRRIPKYFEVRWSEFSATLLDAVLSTWQALVKFSIKHKGTTDGKFLKLLTNKDNILLMCFVADLLFLFKNFQKKLQADSITIVDIDPEVQKLQKRLDNLSKSPLLGGWEEAFKENFDEQSNTFCGIQVWVKVRRHSEDNPYATDRRQFSAIRNDSIAAIKKFLNQSLKIDQNASKCFISFTKFSATEKEIRAVHQSIAPDLDLANLAIQYQDLQDSVEIPKDNPYNVLQTIVKGGEKQYENLSIVLGRILVCKPHSADCERVISLYNKIKSTCRSSLQRQTISDYLYINMNMPPLCDFDPRPAIMRWLDEKDRRIRETPKAGKQDYFNKVFHYDSDSEDLSNKKEKEFKRKF